MWPPLGGGEVSRAPLWGAALVGAEIVWAPPLGGGVGGVVLPAGGSNTCWSNGCSIARATIAGATIADATTYQ